MEIERTKRLKKFSYDPDTFSSIKDRIVTWGNQNKVELIKVIKSTSGPRLVGIIEGEEYDQVLTYTTEGKCVECQNPDMDIYIDESIEVWFNLRRSSDGLHILASCAYYSKEEAEKYKDPTIHFDTICARTILTQNEKEVNMPPITDKLSKPVAKTKMAAYIFSSNRKYNSTEE